MKKTFLILLGLLTVSSSLWAMSRRPPEAPMAVEPAAPLSLSLWDCYQMAVHQSETLATRKEEVNRTMASFLKSSGEFVGDFNYVATDFFQDSTPVAGSGSDVSNTVSEQRLRKFTISQPLFQGFRTIGALSGAGSLKKQRVGEWERAKQLLFMDVANAFYNYLLLNKDVEIIQGIIGLYQDRLEELKEWVEIGKSRESETASVRSRSELFQADLARVKGELAVARHLLAFLIGISVDEEDLLDEKLAASEASTDILVLAQQRPDVQAAEAAVKTARGNFIIAQSELWPSLSFDSNIYEKREGFQSGNSWDTLFTFTVPLGTGGTTLGNMKDAHSTWKEAKLTHRLAFRTAQREIQDAAERYKAAQERAHALERGVSSAQADFNYQKDEYERHLVTNLDVLAALQTLFETKRDANLAFYEVKKYYWQLEVAKGNCCQ